MIDNIFPFALLSGVTEPKTFGPWLVLPHPTPLTGLDIEQLGHPKVAHAHHGQVVSLSEVDFLTFAPPLCCFVNRLKFLLADFLASVFECLAMFTDYASWFSYQFTYQGLSVVFRFAV